MKSESYQTFGIDHGLTAESMAWFWKQYVGESNSREAPLASLANAEDLSSMPPTHIVLAEYDVLFDEGQQFADRLLAANVPTSVRVHDGHLHGFFHFAGLFDEAKTATDAICQWCRELLDH